MFIVVAGRHHANIRQCLKPSKQAVKHQWHILQKNINDTNVLPILGLLPMPLYSLTVMLTAILWLFFFTCDLLLYFGKDGKSFSTILRTLPRLCIMKSMDQLHVTYQKPIWFSWFQHNLGLSNLWSSWSHGTSKRKGTIVFLAMHSPIRHFGTTDYTLPFLW